VPETLAESLGRNQLWYRIYVTTIDGHVTVPATIIECVDDQEATLNAAQLINGQAVELWEGARLIVRFPSDEG
jgi:hypothetical protein